MKGKKILAMALAIMAKIKKSLATGLVLICLTSFLAEIPVQAAVQDTKRTLQEKSTKQNQAKWPKEPAAKKFSCKSAILMELSTGQILYQKNADKKLYPASITKILTAMLTAENCANSEVVTFSEAAAHGIEYGSSTVSTDPGEKLTIEQCLYAIMLESANEVCLGVAEHISGSIEKFVGEMNQRVKELGLKGTHFNNPNGLPDPKHYTTAHDMAVIARAAMDNPTFRKVTATRSYQMPKTNTHKEIRYWRNHHQMINGYDYPKYEYKYCIGGKTGYTDAAGNTLVTYAEKDGMELVCVVMKADNPKYGEPNEYTDTVSLLNFGFEKYKKYIVDEKKSEINQDLFNNYDSYFDSEASPVHLAGESSVVLPKGVELSEAKQTVTYDNSVQLKDGDNTIGLVTYTYGGRTVGSTEIIYTKEKDKTESHLDAASRAIVDEEIQQLRESEKKDMEKANLWNKIKNTVAAFTNITVVRILLIILAVAIVILLLFSLLRHIDFSAWQERHRRTVGGYRSRRGKRRNARRMGGGGIPERHTRHRRTSHRSMAREYQRKTSGTEKPSRSKGVRFHKNHKKTRESFGKNFFDF